MSCSRCESGLPAQSGFGRSQRFCTVRSAPRPGRAGPPPTCGSHTASGTSPCRGSHIVPSVRRNGPQPQMCVSMAAISATPCVSRRPARSARLALSSIEVLHGHGKGSHRLRRAWPPFARGGGRARRPARSTRPPGGREGWPRQGLLARQRCVRAMLCAAAGRSLTGPAACANLSSAPVRHAMSCMCARKDERGWMHGYGSAAGSFSAPGGRA